MKQYLIGFLLVTIGFSCKSLKKNDENKGPMVEEVVEEQEAAEEEESTVLDLLTKDIGKQGDCREDWSKKERKVISRDEARVKRLYDAADGLIYVTARVGKDGYVDFAKIQRLKTTVYDELILNMALEIVEGYQFEPSETAPTNDCGLVRFNLTTM